MKTLVTYLINVTAPSDINELPLITQYRQINIAIPETLYNEWQTS